MASNINEIITPVVGQLRNPSSSGVSKPAVRGSTNVLQDNNVTRPSPGNNSRVETENERPSKETIEKMVAKANELARSLSRTLSFTYDDRIEKVIVKVMEGDSEKVIRQIPPEEMIRLSMRMDDIMGMLINQNV